MTYNRLKNGKIDAREYEDALAALERRYDEVLQRLDGTYQIPKSPQNDP